MLPSYIILWILVEFSVLSFGSSLTDWICPLDCISYLHMFHLAPFTGASLGTLSLNSSFTLFF